MKKILFIILYFLFGYTLYAQVPKLISYQAVARNVSGNVLPNQPVKIRLSILDSTQTGNPLYVETHLDTTNQFGLFSIRIGGGNIISGNFSNILWGAGNKYLKTELDPTGGNNFVFMGTEQLVSVPYALYAENSGTPGPTGPQGLPGPPGCEPNIRDSLIVLYNNPMAYGYSQDSAGTGNWSVLALDNITHLAVSCKKSIVIYDNPTAFAFYRDNSGVGQWSVQPLGNTIYSVVKSQSIIILYNN